FDKRVPADEAALPRRHLLAEHAAVAAAEQVDQTVAGDGVGAEGGGAVEGVALRIEQLVQPRQLVVIKSFCGGKRRSRHPVFRPRWCSASRSHRTSDGPPVREAVALRSLIMLDEFIGQEVVIDLRSPFVCLGTLRHVDDLHLELRNADLHDLRDTQTTRENYVQASHATGIKRNRKRVLVMRANVAAVALLADVVDDDVADEEPQPSPGEEGAVPRQDEGLIPAAPAEGRPSAKTRRRKAAPRRSAQRRR